MIEIEKKFILTDEQKAKLVEGATLVSEKTFTDIYFDTPEYSLTKKDMWLRRRVDRLELKLPMNKAIEERISDQYNELEEDGLIAKELGLDISVKSLEELLKENNYLPFATIVTTRKKYKTGEFGIDVDSMDFGYDLVEIECMIPEGGDQDAKAKETTEKIINFAKQHGIESGFVRGKIIEYIRRNNPAHFDALVAARVTK